MTNPLQRPGRATPLTPRIPRGESIATYETYDEAQQAVDLLARADFPVRQLSIVGSELKSVENVTGKLSYGKAAAAGAVSGAWLGLFLGLLLIIFQPAASSLLFLGAAVLIGAGFGMLFRIVSYTLTRRQRDYTSTMQVIASRYDVVADPEVANRARNLVAPGATWGAAPGYTPPAEPAHPSDPPLAPEQPTP
ncbi:general stress protein [Subtercola boreus]|uniref:general stress protein n=1 Tax=Subtercola boreus TaxID=120213 RepID=UPI00209BCE74|nr:general stress protein [Subtercola boreus]